MFISDQIYSILREIQNQCQTDSQLEILSRILGKNLNSPDFTFIDKGKEDDTILFYNNKLSKMDLTYRLYNPTTVEVGHEIYREVVNSKIDLSKIVQSPRNGTHNVVFKLLAEYKAGGSFSSDYKILHLASQSHGEYFEILHADSLNSKTCIKPIFNDGFEGITVKPSEIKFGRFLNKLLTSLKINFLPKDIEILVNLYKSHNEFTRNSFKYFKVVKGDDITKWYNASNYGNNSGNLNNSCMRFDKCSSFFNIYTNNENVSMLILTNPTNKLVGRALLWETEQGKYMDRVYSNDHMLNLFKRWAKENDYNLSHTIGSNSKNIQVSVNVDLDKPFPYLDSFKFLVLDKEDMSKGILHTCQPQVTSLYLNEANGSYQTISR